MSTSDDLYDNPLDAKFLDFDIKPLSDPWSSEADDHYPIWSIKLESLLMIALRWDVVCGKDVCPVLEDVMSPEEKDRMEQRVDKWVQRDAQARLIIMRALSPTYIVHVTANVEDKTAKAFWDRIRHWHIEQGRGMKILRVFRRMHARKYEEGMRLADFAGGFSADNVLLGMYGVGLSSEQLAVTIMQALPWHDEKTRYALYAVVDKIFATEEEEEEEEEEEDVDADTRLIRALRGIDNVKAQGEPREGGASRTVSRRSRRTYRH
ncbi:hypothetical protein LXA43DRAFT_45674 [Ganoderma leucocontextum]|nr:hypothetical protein LXA43DRAFT_45674 [Ganoderma leucocontextum]